MAMTMPSCTTDLDRSWRCTERQPHGQFPSSGVDHVTDDGEQAEAGEHSRRDCGTRDTGTGHHLALRRRSNAVTCETPSGSDADGNVNAAVSTAAS